MQPVDLMRGIHRSADHLNGRSYLLLGRQPSPGQHRFLQGGEIGQSAGSIVERRWPPRIDMDFVVVGHQRGPYAFRARISDAVEIVISNGWLIVLLSISRALAACRSSLMRYSGRRLPTPRPGRKTHRRTKLYAATPAA